MVKKAHVTIIILNWNGKHLLEKNLPSVFEQDYPEYDILIVDNNSEDDSIEYINKLKRKKKNLHLLVNKKNYGYAEGNNKGIKKVGEDGVSEFIVLLNNDVRVEESWLTRLIDGFDNEKVGICTAKLLLYYPYQQVVVVPREDVDLKSLTIDNHDYHPLEYPEGFENKGELLVFPKKLVKEKVYHFAIPYKTEETLGNLIARFDSGKLRIFIGEEKMVFKIGGEQQIDLKGKYVIQNAGTTFHTDKLYFLDRYLFEFDRILESEIVDAGCGASMAIRADLLKKLGGFRKKYFMYFEDTELSYRFQQRGFTTRYIDNALGYHYFWGSSGGKVTKRQILYGTRNRLWFIRRYFGIRKFLYYYFRTYVRTMIWGLKSLTGSKNAKLHFLNYSKALIEVLQPDE